MDVNLTIDYREKKLISLIENPQVANLELGDIVFSIVDKSANLTNYELIIERKSINDLVSSIKDNRYKEQKIRLLSYKDSAKHTVDLMYLIEGSITKLRNPKYETKMYHGSLISILFRDNIKLIFTEDLKETAEIIKRINSRLVKNKNDFNIVPLIVENNPNSSNDIKQINIIDKKQKQRGGNEYLASRVKKKKSDNISPENIAALMLTYLPGVSINISTELMRHFDNNLTNLVNYITNNENDIKSKTKYLSKLKIKTSSGKERNLGPSITNTIIEYILNNDEEKNKTNK